MERSVKIFSLGKILLVLCVLVLSSCTPDVEYKGSKERLEESIDSLRYMGRLEEVIEQDVSYLTSKKGVSLLSQDEVDARVLKENGYGGIEMTYLMRGGGYGVLEEIDITIGEGLGKESADSLRKRLNIIFKEKPDLKFREPVTKEERYYVYDERSGGSAELYYNSSSGILLSIDVIPIGSRRVSYYASKMYESGGEISK